MNANTFNVVSLFSGMCGMDIGFAEQVIVHRMSVNEDLIDENHNANIPSNFVALHRQPFRVVFQNDILPIAQKIATWNNWATNYILRDICELLDSNFEFPQADVVIGGFPCQDFSHSGKRKGFANSRGTLYRSFVDVVHRVKPKMFVAENVHGLLTMQGNPITQIIDDFKNEGYDVKYQLIKCEEYGIPQTRWRVIIMGLCQELLPYVEDNWNEITDNRRQCKLKNYLAHLSEPTDTDDIAQKIHSKAACLDKGQGQKEVDLESFAPTIRAEHHGNIEFRRKNNGVNNENHLPQRRLTIREVALIQTFPPSCILTDPSKNTGTGAAYKPIGNAVPPLLGYLIAKKVSHVLSSCMDKCPSFFNRTHSSIE